MASAGVGIRDLGFGIRFDTRSYSTTLAEHHEPRIPKPESRIPVLCGGANDAGAGEAIVKAAPIAAHDRGEEAEAGRDREQHPHERAQERATEVERGFRLGGDDADAGGHLAERL